MAIKLSKDEGVFRNELINTTDAKTINIDNTLVNLFMLLKHNGLRPKQRARKGENVETDISRIYHYFSVLEEKGELAGVKDNKEAIEIWIRCNLANLVNRGHSEKEMVSSLKPIHLESYRIRNAKKTRDYYSADQVYLMLSQKPAIKNELKAYLMEGWDLETNQFLQGNKLDIDSLGILHLIKNIKPGFIESNSSLNLIKPLLPKQAELYCEDVHRLLVYKNEIPRNVLIDYLKTITSFHLALYTFKVINYLPRMLEEGTLEVEDDWRAVVDVTDNFDSKISTLAIQDAEKNYNGVYNYVRAGVRINSIISLLDYNKYDSQSVGKAMAKIKYNIEDVENTFKAAWLHLFRSQDADEDRDLMTEFVKYENSYFEKYTEFLFKQKGPYQLKYYPQFMDSICQKNNDRGFLAQGRSKKHPRRFVLGTRLLEALVQIQVLKLDGDKFITQSISIEDLMQSLKDRYGLVINGLDDERFKQSDVFTNLAFKENVEAFKYKLRQIGFYSDMSDAYILQKVRPRYELK